ncbi:MAG: hypothetical protein O8C67_15650 [Candidatus Methanoperedens sp.]|nr:hypothetical protein [Candidatus Methanoperedens sp.]
MAKHCAICIHKFRCEIDQLIINKEPYATIATRFRIKGKNPIQVIKGHVFRGHVQKNIAETYKNEEIKKGLVLSECVKEIYNMSIRAAQKAYDEDLKAYGSCMAQAKGVLEFLPSDQKEEMDLKQSGFASLYLDKAEEHYKKEPDNNGTTQA